MDYLIPIYQMAAGNVMKIICLSISHTPKKTFLGNVEGPPMQDTPYPRDLWSLREFLGERNRVLARLATVSCLCGGMQGRFMAGDGQSPMPHEGRVERRMRKREVWKDS